MAKKFYKLTFLTLIFASLLFSQSIDKSFWATDAPVWCFEKYGNTLYFGGAFTQVFRPRIGIALVDNSDEQNFNPNFPEINTGGYIWTAIPDGAGGWYVGGSFTQIGGIARNNIAHILPDGSVDLSFLPNGANGIVYALALNNEGGTWYLYVGGAFTIINGVARNRIAKIDLSTGQVTSWNPNANNVVYSILPDPSGLGIYVGGAFTNIGGAGRNRLARLNPTTGSADTWNPNVGNGAVFTIQVYGTTVYVGGTFTLVGGNTRNRIVGISSSTGAVVWYPVGGANNTVYSLKVLSTYGDFLLCGGDFTIIAGQTRNRLCSFNLITGNLTTWAPNVNGTVYSVSGDISNIFIGGSFTTVDGQPRNRVAKFDNPSFPPVLSSWNPSANNTVYVVLPSGSNVFIGGNFTTINLYTRNYIASIDLSTGKLTNWNPGTNNTVLTMLAVGSTLYIGGQFTVVAGQTRNRLASFNLPAGTLTSWNPSANSDVRAMATDGVNFLFVGGAFTSITQGAVTYTRNYLASFSLSSGLISPWAPNANGFVYALSVSGGSLYVGGAFTTIHGQTRNRLAKFDINTGELLSWAPNVNNTVWAIAVSGSNVYIGGQFTSVNLTTRNYIALVDAVNGTLLPWNPNANGQIYTIALTASTAYVGGAFTTIGGQTRNRIAGIDLTTGFATSWNPNADDAVYTILLSPSTARAYIGGQFTQIMGVSYSYLASLTIPDLFEQSLVIGFSVNSISVITGSTGNTAYIRLSWLDRMPPEEGVYSFTFEITSTSISINSGNISLHPSISGICNISKTNIPGGVRVTITGNSPGSLLIDNGSSEGIYLVAVLTFDAPSTDGTYTINLTNINPAQIRIVSPPYTLSNQTITNGYTTLTVNSITLLPITVPYFTPVGYTQNRKYGDINWDGSIDISDITSLADVIIEKYSAVTVNDPSLGSRYFYEGNGYNGTNADKADRRASDVWGTGGDGDPTNGEGNDQIEQMDLAVLVDAVTSGAWPSYSGVIPAIAGKPSFKITDENSQPENFHAKFRKITTDVFVNFEIFNPGEKSSKIKVTVENESYALKGLQIEFVSSALPEKINIWTLPDASALKLAWARNEFNKIVILLYAEGGRTFKTGKISYFTIVLPGVTVEQLIASEPKVIASINNFSYNVGFNVSNALGIMPSTYMLHQNYPNPFNSGTAINFEIPEYSSVKLIIWNSLGQKVKELYDGNVAPGRYKLFWDGKDNSGNFVSSGIYFYTLYAKSLEDGKEFTMTRKAILMK